MPEFVPVPLGRLLRRARREFERQRTIFKVATSIVQRQRAFLDHGIDQIRPLVLRDVAEGREVGDTTTLADTAVMSVISAQVK